LFDQRFEKESGEGWVIANTIHDTIFPMKRLLITSIIFLAAWASFAAPLPYNYRLVEDHIHAGGHPLGPTNNFKNSDKQVLAILNYLKSKEVTTIIDLENTRSIQKRYTKLLKQAGIKRIHIPMHESKVPSTKEWAIIKKAMAKPVYIHCKWGADRTGAVLGRYLVEIKGYEPKKAYAAVITKGSHAGPLGGLKTSLSMSRLKRWVFLGP